MLRLLINPSCRQVISTRHSSILKPNTAFIPSYRIMASASSTSAAAVRIAPLQLSQLEGVEAAKRAAAYAAVDNHVQANHKIIGIGSGSTVPFVVERIVQQGEKVNADRWFIPTGFQSKQLIVNNGLRLGDVDSFPEIDVTIDGADEVDTSLNAIKGGGACQLREKVLAEAAKTFIVVADYRKNSSILGQSWKQGVPVEVAEFAWSKVQRQLMKMKGNQTAPLRMGKMKAGPVVTDNGNFVIDAIFDEEQMKKPKDLLKEIKLLTGVMEVGLFVNMCQAAYFGNENGTITAKHKGGNVESGITFDVTRNPIVS